METTTTPDTTAVALAAPMAPIDQAIMEQVLIGGNLAQLTEPQRLAYYRAVCQSLGLNPLTKPFEFLTLNGKLRLYALRDCADQLRRLHSISIYIANREKISDIYVVTARAKDKTGREDESTGAVPLGHLRGDALANALMKAETKAKRRVTLSIAGLGWLDETELETVKGVVMGASDTPVATIHDAVLDERVAPATEPADVTRYMAGLREERQASAPKQPAGNGAPTIPEDVEAAIKAILARVVWLYPGDKADPTVLEDRKNMLHAIFGREIDSGMAGVRQLAELGFDALRNGLSKLDRVQREAPPSAKPVADEGQPVHPDITATAELIGSLKERAGRAGVAPETFDAWLESKELALTGEGEPILSVQERGLLAKVFNEALAELKRAQGPADGNSARPRRASQPPRSGRKAATG
jgi:hypothetical protein